MDLPRVKACPSRKDSVFWPDALARNLAPFRADAKQNPKFLWLRTCHVSRWLGLDLLCRTRCTTHKHSSKSCSTSHWNAAPKRNAQEPVYQIQTGKPKSTSGVSVMQLAKHAEISKRMIVSLSRNVAVSKTEVAGLIVLPSWLDALNMLNPEPVSRPSSWSILMRKPDKSEEVGGSAWGARAFRNLQELLSKSGCAKRQIDDWLAPSRKKQTKTKEWLLRSGAIGDRPQRRNMGQGGYGGQRVVDPGPHNTCPTLLQINTPAKTRQIDLSQRMPRAEGRGSCQRQPFSEDFKKCKIQLRNSNPPHFVCDVM